MYPRVESSSFSLRRPSLSVTIVMSGHRTPPIHWISGCSFRSGRRRKRSAQLDREAGYLGYVTERTLSPAEAGRAYDRIGRLQDWQRFYEGPATRVLETHAEFGLASSVYELGCGTGAYAERLLDRLLPRDATYRGVDVSHRMIALSSSRIEQFEERASVELIPGEPPLPGPDHAFDRFLAIYVLDLLSDDLARAMFEEARRLLEADGKMCLVALSNGQTAPSRAVCSIWNAVWRRSPSLVGGCRPIDIPALLDDSWIIDHASTVTAWAVTSQIVVARPGGDGTS